MMQLCTYTGFASEGRLQCSGDPVGNQASCESNITGQDLVWASILGGY